MGAMRIPIEDHAFISDRRSGALITRTGTISWLCLPRFDSAAVFASLLGEDDNGHWDLAIDGGTVVERDYLPGTLVLRTRWQAPTGVAEVLDLMPLTTDAGVGDSRSDVLRVVRCVEGEVTVTQRLRIRFGYGEHIPWVTRHPGEGQDAALVAVAGADAVVMHGPGLVSEDMSHRADTTLTAGQEASWQLTWFWSWLPVPAPLAAGPALTDTADAWRSWLGQVRPSAEYTQIVERSLLVLHGLTQSDTGGIAAAATTSLPEDFGGIRNWDYRYCWLRDASLSLEALLAHGHVAAATAWRDWLLRAIAGESEELQIMYTLAGGRRMPERELGHLRGYADSRPVRIGNGAAPQYQADVIGEVMLALAKLRDAGVAEDRFSWPLQKRLVQFALNRLDTKDQGLWEMRGEPQFFTHGRVMIWAAFDRALDAVRTHGLPATAEEIAAWEQARDRLRAEILERGVDASGSFVQTYDNQEVDASLLQIPHTGFLPADDPHMLATVRRIEADLVDEHGWVRRYRTTGSDGLAGDEAPFVICTLWLVEQYARTGRVDDARALMDKVTDAAGELLLLAEEYDPARRRMVGNTPQAFSHLGIIRAADALAGRPIS